MAAKPARNGAPALLTVNKTSESERDQVYGAAQTTTSRAACALSPRLADGASVVVGGHVLLVHGTGSIRDDDWSSLTSAIENGTCILMLGPDAFMAEFDGETAPGRRRPRPMGASREKLHGRLGPEDADLDPSNPWAVAQVAVAKEDAYTVRSWAERFYETHDTVSEALAAARLPAVPARDQHVARADRRGGVPRRQAGHVQRLLRPHGTRSDADARPVRATAPVVYNLFGSLKNKDSMLLSEYDRFEFLIAVIKENAAAPGEAAEPAARPQPVVPVHRLQPRPVAAADARSTCSPTTSSGSTSRSPSSSMNDDVDSEARLFYMRGHTVALRRHGPRGVRCAAVGAAGPARAAVEQRERRRERARQRQRHRAGARTVGARPCSCATPTRTRPSPSR